MGDDQSDIEISGAWYGDTLPPKVLKNFYRNKEDQLLQDVFQQTQVSYHTQAAQVYGLHNLSPLGFVAGSNHSLVSYRLIETKDVSPLEIVTDFVFGNDNEEYTTWNLYSRMEK